MRITPRLVRSLLSLGLVTVMTVALAPVSAAASALPKLPWQGPAALVKPGSLVVTFRSGTSTAARRGIHAEAGARVADQGRSTGIDVVELPEGVRTLDAIRSYQADPRVLAAEPDRVAVSTVIPDDQHFGKQWWAHNVAQSHPMTESGYVGQNNFHGVADADIDAPEAWDATTPGDDVVVAILDTGVDVDHPDLVDAMWVNTVEQSGLPDVDDDANGYVDDINGWDFRADDPNPSPGTALIASHGTHVAGIVGAERDNDIGIAGVCAACRIMALRFDLSLGQEVDAIQYAIDNGADVINMSFASPVWSPAERTAIRHAGQAGVLTVAAAGNASLDNDIATYIEHSFAPGFPASYNLPTVLSVAASNHNDEYGLVTECDLSAQAPRWTCGFTSWGHDSVDVAAPGVDIVSTVNPAAGGDVQAGYQVWDGTSMAAPVVAGIAGLVKHEHPTYGPVDLKNAVMNSVDHRSRLKLVTSWARLTGLPRSSMAGRFTRTQGRVNALEALDAPTTNATPLTDGNINGAVPLGGSAEGRVIWPGDANDVFRKRLVAGNRYRIRLDGPNAKDFDLWVWSPGTKEIYQFTAGCFTRHGPCPALRAVSGSLDADEQVTFTVQKTATFYIQVQGWYSSGLYSMSVRRV